MFKAITIAAVILFVISLAALDSGTAWPYVTMITSDAWIFYALWRMDKLEADDDV